FDVSGSYSAVGPNGELYIAYADAGDGFNPGGDGDGGIGDETGLPGSASINIVKSLDGGVTFTAPLKVASLTGVNSNITGGFGGLRTSSFPTLAVDNKGVVHIAYDAISDNT